MSSVYHTEPPTLGKVIFHTSYGPIDVELWSKEAPRACRNFVQLALEGYYDRTVFHRVIPGFMVQGGDPTGTGEGGDSVWGKAFRDETNARIRFNHRGQLAMANENKPDTNRSQFFFSLDECRWLDGKHTIFGTVAGNTVFNLLRMGEAELENDRPVEDIVLKTVEVLANPFDDVVPRPVSSSEPEVAEKKVPQRKATKDLKLLSFGGEEEPLPEEAPAAKQKPRPVPLPGFSPYDSDDSDDSEAAPPKKRVVDRARDAGDFSAKMAARLKERQARAKRREAKTEDDVGEKLAAIKEESRKARAALKVAPATAKSRGTKRSAKDRENDTLARLENFKQAIRTTKRSTPPVAEEAASAPTYEGQVLEEDDEGGDDDGNATDWFVGKLQFKKHTDDLFRNSEADAYFTVDPRTEDHLWRTPR